MTPTLSFRDVEQLSAYLDGQLTPTEVASLESRLASNPELAAALEELRQARSVLRQLPQRSVPRNFTLTPKLVGLKPPLPRTYPIFRLASVVATLLLFLSFAANFMAPRLAAQVVSVPYGIGGGGGEPELQEPSMALEAPPEPVEPAAPPGPAANEPEVDEEPAAPEFAAQPAESTPTAPVEGESLRAQPTALPTQTPQEQREDKAGTPEQPAVGEESGQLNAATAVPEPSHRPVPVSWQIGLATFVLMDVFILLVLRRNAAAKWRKTK
jgi:hypothetical protein